MNTSQFAGGDETIESATIPALAANRGSLSSQVPGGLLRYSIAAVSKLTGVGCHTLRVWERRYGFPAPGRSPSGHRRYSSDQVQVLCQIARRMAAGGGSIGELVGEFQHKVAGLEKDHSQRPSLEMEGGSTRLLELLALGQGDEAEREYQVLASRLEPRELIDRVIWPSLIETGERWFRREFSIYQERLVTVFLRRKLMGLIDQAHQAHTPNARSMVVGTVEGDRHEGGLLILHHALEMKGWKVHSLGSDLPVREFRASIQRLNPDAIAISFVLSRNIQKRFQELQEIREIPIFVGGRSILNYQSLARQHGLIPLPGPIDKAFEQLETEFELWQERKDLEPEVD